MAQWLMDEDNERINQLQTQAKYLINFLQTELQSGVEQFTSETSSSLSSSQQKDSIKSMTDEDLEQLQSELEEKLQKVKEEKERRFQTRAYCIICKSNIKNIGILGCNHLDLCQQCESKSSSKQCPRCMKHYQKIVVIKRWTFVHLQSKLCEQFLIYNDLLIYHEYTLD